MNATLAGILALGVIAGCSSPESGRNGSGRGGGVPETTPSCREVLEAETCEALEAIELPSELPAAKGNAHGDVFEAALLGFHVFFDIRFSKDNSVRCESCHSVDYGFADNVPTSTAGLGRGARNAPTIFNAARHTTFFWDGRADSLWSQPLFAFENPNEMGFTRLEIAHRLGDLYAEEYEDAFGPLPDLSDGARFPEKGAPGEAAFDAMTPGDQKTVNGVAANLGKALEAYMRHVATGRSPVDEYLAGDRTALTAEQAQGMIVFARSGCLACHKGPTLSDDAFHNLGVAAAPGKEADRGRAGAIEVLKNSPFNASGPFSDGAPGETDLTPVLGGFRTPSLRNLVGSGPYGHNGTFATLEEIVDFHLQGGGRGKGGFVGTVDGLLAPQSLSEEDRAALVAFLRALVGSYPSLPWGQWPNGNG